MAFDTVAVRLHDGSRTLGQGVGADADGHPLDAVARLAGVFSFDGASSIEVVADRRRNLGRR